MTDVIKAFAGIDWASEAHQVGLVDPAGTILGERAVVHGGAGLSELCEWLVATAPAEPGEIAVAIEVSHGPIVETLLERGFLVFSLNPKQLDRFRDRHTVAGTKDDRLDADVAGDALRTDRHCFRRLNRKHPASAAVRRPFSALGRLSSSTAEARAAGFEADRLFWRAHRRARPEDRPRSSWP
jgi:hypothetical protein